MWRQWIDSWLVQNIPQTVHVQPIFLFQLYPSLDTAKLENSSYVQRKVFIQDFQKFQNVQDFQFSQLSHSLENLDNIEKKKRFVGHVWKILVRNNAGTGIICGGGGGLSKNRLHF